MNPRPVSYLQTDPRWGALDYSARGEKTNIAVSGCGPPAAANGSLSDLPARSCACMDERDRMAAASA